jgi:1,4-alpha-glucan branching enzyme
MKRSNPGGVSPDKKVAIEFVYQAPNAKEVCLAGGFNNWDARSLPMKKNKQGLWRTTVKLAPGRHEYKYVVDGSWVTDSRCPEVVMNDKGSTNCVVSVAPQMAA